MSPAGRRGRCASAVAGGLEHLCRPIGATRKVLLRLERVDRRPELDHGLRRIPHALEMRLELRRRARVADHNEVVVLCVLAARAEIRRACS